MKEGFPEIIKNKEFIFEDGVEYIINKVNLLLSTKNHVVISIHGRTGVGFDYDDTNVGKTYLQNELCKKLGSEEDVAVEGVSDIESIKRWKFLPKHLKETGCSKFVLIIGADDSLAIPKEKRNDYKKHRNIKLQKAAESIGMQLDEIDIDILIYRPDKPINTDEFETADIVIKNDYATDKQ